MASKRGTIIAKKLGLIQVEIDQGTPNNGGWSFTSGGPTINSLENTERFLSWQPSNITIVWSQGKETFLFNHYSFAKEDSSSKYDGQEKLLITSVYTNSTSDAVFIDVNVPKINVNFIHNVNVTDVFITRTDETWNNAIATVHLNTLVNESQSKTLRINCALSSGNYTVKLVTANGSVFVSPSFNVP